MNRFLADAVSALNAILACAIILVGLLAGLAASNQSGGSFIMVATILGSILVSVLVCGLLALVIDIRNSNREIVELLKRRGL